MKVIFVFLVLYLAIAVANRNKKRDTNVQDNKREKVVSYITSCIAESEKDSFSNSIPKTEEMGEYLACIYKSITLDDAYVQKSIKGCMGSEGLHEIQFLISTMKERPVFHDHYLANDINCLAKELKIVYESVKSGIRVCLRDNNLNEGVLNNKKNASPIEQENIRKYFDCIKFKLGDRYREIYAYLEMCPEMDNYEGLFDPRKISFFQHQRMDSFGHCMYRKLGHDNRMVVKYITSCLVPPSEENEIDKDMKKTFTYGITEGLNIDHTKVSSVNEGGVEPTLNCIYILLWDDVKLLMKYLKECLVDYTYDEVQAMLLYDNEIYVKPRNSFKDCIKGKLGDMGSFNINRATTEN